VAESRLAQYREDMDWNVSDYDRIAAAIRFIGKSAKEQPSLEGIAAHIGLSPWHFQRLFTRWAGVSPKRFLQHVTVEAAKRCLEESAPILETAFAVGLSGPSRLHDLFIHAEAVTPGGWKSSGRGMELRWGLHASPFGICLLALSPLGICSLQFLDADASGSSPEDAAAAALSLLQRKWKNADLVRDDAAGAPVIAGIFGARKPGSAFSLHLRGTNFQLKVWKALLEIPEGSLASYGRVAEAVECPGAARAIGSAAGENPIAFLIPCHRVLRENGDFGGYRWGLERKRAMLGRELLARGQEAGQALPMRAATGYCPNPLSAAPRPE
jgi:AraC family transcriptional regulator of adaptative response/methylated-DNA-[protein]-cysteine methyltransferase